MAMAFSKRSWWLLALAASARLAMGQMDMDHDDMDMSHTASSSAEPSSTAASSSAQKTHTVLVGYKGHSFLPSNTKAKAGDTIEFHFQPTNHSVVRAEYMWPCVPYESVGNGKEGFFSGFFHVGEGDGTPKWRYTISTDNAIYFYSSAGDDCNVYGMVGAINAPSKDLEHQAAMALDAPFVGQPGAAKPASETSATPTPTPTPPPAGSDSATEEPSSDSSSGIGKGAIAGIVIGAISGIAIIAGLFYWYGILRARQQPPPNLESSPMAQSSYLSPDGGGGANPSFDTRSGMFSSHGVPSPPPAALGLSTPEHAQGPFVDGDTIYVPVKRSTIAIGDMGSIPAELYNPAEIYHPGVPVQNSDTSSWNRGFEQDAHSVHGYQGPTPPPPAGQRQSVNIQPSELSS